MEFQPRWKHKFEVKPGRWVYIPDEEELEFGQDLIKQLSLRWRFPSYLYHLNLGGHVAAVRSHLRMNSFCCLDIENFFGSISKNRVARVLKSIVGHDQARDIASRSTVKVRKPDGIVYQLPYGFCQSPLLASMVLDASHLGSFVRNLICDRRFSVSVYMDDIIISAVSEDILKIAFDGALNVLQRSRFAIAQSKVQPPSSSVESFNIVLSHSHMGITDERMEKFKVQYRDAANEHVKEGIAGYIGTVNPAQVPLLY